MTFSWLGRRGFGGIGSSHSLRGSLTVSVMASSKSALCDSRPIIATYNLLILLDKNAHLSHCAQFGELQLFATVGKFIQLNKTTQSSHFG
jgi:hypothetical protein